MSIGSHANAITGPLRKRITRAILRHRVQARYPTLRADPSAIWEYDYQGLDALEIGENVIVEPYAFILVYRRSPHSNVPGRLILGHGCGIGFGVNIRAAGGTIRIGAGAAIAQHCVLVAANHTVDPNEPRVTARWDEERCGIDVGENVWVGATCVLLPGCVIGDDAIIAAGSVVRGTVPAGELWGGVPARKIRSLAVGHADQA